MQEQKQIRVVSLPPAKPEQENYNELRFIPLDNLSIFAGSEFFPAYHCAQNIP